MGPKPAGWDTMSAEERSTAVGSAQTARPYLTGYIGGTGDGKGDDGGLAAVNPYTGQAVNGPPQAADLTDQLLQKTRTNFALRLQTGANRAGSFGGAQTGGLVLGGGNKAGGY